MKTTIACLALSLFYASSNAIADSFSDCEQGNNWELKYAGCSRLIESRNRASWALSHRAWASNELGQFDRAIDDATKAIGLDPSNAWAFFNRGDAYESTGSVDKAIADYARALAVEPRHTASREALLRLRAKRND